MNADTGAPAVRRVLRTAEIYDGPRLDALPDLLVEWNTEPPSTPFARRFSERFTSRIAARAPATIGARASSSVAGRPSSRAMLAAPVDLVDVAPTIAALLGVELSEVDGRPISACLPATHLHEARWAASK